MGFVSDVASRIAAIQMSLGFGEDSIETVVEDCVIFRNADDGLEGLGATRCTFRRNIVFDSNPNGTVGGDGNGIKIGVRGGLDNIAYHNISFDNPRDGIDMADTERSVVYNNTLFNNRKKGLRFEASRATIGGATVVNNVVKGSGQNDIVFVNSARVTLLEFNSVSDASNAGTNGFVSTDPLFDNEALVIDTAVPAGKTVFDLRDYILSQVIAKFTLSTSSPLIDNGKVIVGITDGFLGSAPDIGAIESE